MSSVTDVDTVGYMEQHQLATTSTEMNKGSRFS